jgi:aryl-alcohol dehydrogenase-like predicted oxidoreductase
MLTALKRVGARHNASGALVAQRWALSQPCVAAAVVGARNAAHLGDARRVFAFDLTEEDCLDLDAAYESAVQPAGDVYAWERGGAW